MERKYLDNLIEWKNDKNKKPLLVLGARQVGKTYLIEKLFAKNFYKNSYLRIDCSNEPEFVDYILKNPNLEKTIDYIQIKYNFHLDENHLLIIDEAQECLPIIQLMKQFCEKRREIPLIVTGSLVRIRIRRNAHKRGGFAEKSFLFPVGKINRLNIYPLTFDEFLLNYSKNTYEYVKSCFESKKEIDKMTHELLMDIFHDYLFVGGMPEVVDTFLKNKNNKLNAYTDSLNVIKDIYSDYLSDMELYQASDESILRSRMIFNNIYSQLNKENKNFKTTIIDKKFKNRDLFTPIEWLLTTNIVYKASQLKEHVTSPLISPNESLYRLYLSDMGLFTYQSGLNTKSFYLNKNNSLSGIYYENYVSIELSARYNKLFYWKGKRDSELEFILDYQGRIIPLDVKKNKGNLNSLEEFRSHNNVDIAIKVSTNNFGYDKEKKILTIPFYYFSFFLNDLNDNKFNY